MRNRSRGVPLQAAALVLGFALAASVLAPPVQADPPPWAPHGYRAKPKPEVENYVVYMVPYGIDRGYCDRGLVSSEVAGGTVGAAAGAPIGKGAGKAATAGGAVLGVMVGSAIGKMMDRVDHNCVGRILEYAPDRRRVFWSNAENGHEYAIVPMRTYERSDGLYCREYQTTATVAGRVQQTHGTACRQSDGAWKIAN